MANNNSEAITFIKFAAGESDDPLGLSYSYSSIDLSSSFIDEDQLEIIRVFDISTVPELVTNAPTGKELEGIYSLPYVAISGSSMYTVDASTQEITFSTSASDFIWTAAVNGRGGDIALPVFDYITDVVIIRRKTFSYSPNTVWVDGSKITAAGLNARTSQLMQLTQEMRSILLNPELFDYALGAAEGVCPLDANGVVPLKHISEQLGGGGILAVDLSTRDLTELKDVDITYPITDGDVISWDNASQNWINIKPLSKTVDTSGADNHSVLIWEDSTSTWQLKTFEMEDLTDVNVNNASLVHGQLLMYDDPAVKWQPTDLVYYTGEIDGVSYTNELTPAHVLTWNTTTNKWEARVRPDVTYEVFNLNDTSLFDLMDVNPRLEGQDPYEGVVEGDILSFFYWDGVSPQGGWRAQSIDTWDWNNCWNGDDEILDPSHIGYTGGYQGPIMWRWHDSGWTLYWQEGLAQKDHYQLPDGSEGPYRGSFKTGPMFAPFNLEAVGSKDIVNWAQAGTVDGVDLPGRWTVQPLNMNHLSDVDARVFPIDPDGNPIYNEGSEYPDTGSYLVWDPQREKWRVEDPPEGGTFGDAPVYHTASFKFRIRDETGGDNVLWSPSNHFAGCWMEMWTNPFTSITIESWSLFANANCRCRCRVYKTTLAHFGNIYNEEDKPGGLTAWDNVTYNDLDNSQNHKSHYVLGFGQGGGSQPGYGKKKISYSFPDGNYYFEKETFVKDDMIVVELENFIRANGNPTNQLHLELRFKINIL